MKTKEELNALKEKVETLNKKLAELTEEELTQISGGMLSDPVIWWSYFECSVRRCGFRDHIKGNYGDQTIDCPKCGQHTWVCVETEMI